MSSVPTLSTVDTSWISHYCQFAANSFKIESKKDAKVLILKAYEALEQLRELSNEDSMDFKSFLQNETQLKPLLELDTKTCDAAKAKLTSFEAKVYAKVRNLSTVLKVVTAESQVQKSMSTEDMDSARLDMCLDIHYDLICWFYDLRRSSDSSFNHVLSCTHFFVPLLKLVGMKGGGPKELNLFAVSIMYHLVDVNLFQSFLNGVNIIAGNYEANQTFHTLWKQHYPSSPSQPRGFLATFEMFEYFVMFDINNLNMSGKTVKNIINKLWPQSIGDSICNLLPTLEILQSIMANPSIDNDITSNKLMEFVVLNYSIQDLVAFVIFRLCECQQQEMSLVVDLLRQTVPQLIELNTAEFFRNYSYFTTNSLIESIYKSHPSHQEFSTLQKSGLLKIQMILEFVDVKSQDIRKNPEMFEPSKELSKLYQFLVCSLRGISSSIEIFDSSLLQLRLTFREIGCKLNLETVLCQLITHLSFDLALMSYCTISPVLINEMRFVQSPPVAKLNLGLSTTQDYFSGSLMTKANAFKSLTLALDIYSKLVKSNKFKPKPMNFATCLSVFSVKDQNNVIEKLGLKALEITVSHNWTENLHNLLVFLLKATSKDISLIDPAKKAMIYLVSEWVDESLFNQMNALLLQELTTTWSSNDREKVSKVLKVLDETQRLNIPESQKPSVLDITKLNRFLNLSEVDKLEITKKAQGYNHPSSYGAFSNLKSQFRKG